MLLALRSPSPLKVLDHSNQVHNRRGFPPGLGLKTGPIAMLRTSISLLCICHTHKGLLEGYLTLSHAQHCRLAVWG